MPFDTIVFDLDGTLVDTAGDLAASLNHALDVLGRSPVPPADVRMLVGRGARHLLARGLAATGPVTPGLVEAGVGPFLDFYRRNIATLSRPFPGAEQALDSLAADGFRLAICTNKPEALAVDLIAALGWRDRFQALLGADSRPWRKPDPRHLLATVAAAGGSAALFVGDSVTDRDTARAAAAPLILVRFGYSEEPVETLEADRLIACFAELPAAVREVQGRFSAAA
jgi:phosphoglycolate phosphatase